MSTLGQSFSTDWHLHPETLPEFQLIGTAELCDYTREVDFNLLRIILPFHCVIRSVTFARHESQRINDGLVNQ